MPTVIDTISSMSSTEASDYLKVNGFDEGSIAEVMVEWEEVQNKPAPVPIPVTHRKTTKHTHDDGTTHSHPNTGDHDHDE